MQTVTLLLHIAGIFLAVYIYRKSLVWKYFALMLLFSNIVGAAFYVYILFDLPFKNDLSQFRSLIQAIILLMFSLSLRGRHND